ncbi:hypothetical protein [Pseudomonas putida]|uniref:Uncharacterized protein n=1 Tax=Pseudomonas putida TaxID=303 RepID=A0A8I1ECJ3_PSEPU|nr:hypothetical protein [Pseudomonas putida]MBI6882857.1 hypothetical protein [Pseudomonas putida]
MQTRKRNIGARLDDVAIESIFREFNIRRLHEVYDNSSLADMHEFLVEVFKSKEWKDPSYFNPRNFFIQSIKTLPVTDADHRRVFLAMADAGNSHAVISYLHMIGHKERVFLKNHQALITVDDLAMMVKDRGFRMAPAIHFLCRATVATQAEGLPRLWKELSKAYQPDMKFSERFKEGMQTLVRRFGIKSLGLGKDDDDHQPWIDRFLTTSETSIKDIASTVVAGQLVTRRLGRFELEKNCSGLSQKMRLVNDLGFDISVAEATSVYRSHPTKKAEFRLSEGLTR